MATPEVGIREGLSYEEYDANDCVTGGFLFTMMEKSPAHAMADKLGDGDTTEALTFGSAFHTAILEPEALEDRYVAKPHGMSFATREGKAWRAEQSREIITADQWNDLLGMRDAVYSDSLAGSILHQDGLREASVFWQEQSTYGKSIGAEPIWCKGRPDFIPEGMLVDLKTTLDARPRAFSRQADTLGYWTKMSFYQHGLELAGGKRPREVFLIAIEKVKPYAINVFLVPTETLNTGRTYMEAALFRFRECRDSGVWPAFGGAIHPIVLPPWRIEMVYGGRA